MVLPQTETIHNRLLDHSVVGSAVDYFAQKLETITNVYSVI